MPDDLMQQETTDDADFSTLNGALGEIVALRAHAPCGVSGEIHRTAIQAQRLPPEDLAGRREALETIKTWAKERYDDVYRIAKGALKLTDPASARGTARP